MSELPSHPIEVLLVEDSPTDAELTLEALEDAKVRVNLHLVEDGLEAMDFLHQTGKYSKAPRPDLILLDLNLPKKDGREVLQEIRSDEGLAIIPVVVLTTSEDEKDIIKAYKAKANCYVTKPVDFTQFIDVVNSIDHFWFTVVKLPKSL